MQFLFAFTLFVSAFLLFLVQPLVAKMLLPLLGGAPAVWNTCLFYFQCLLLAGYGYAHLVTKRLELRLQAILQIALLAAAMIVFPIAISPGFIQSLGHQPSPFLWLLGCLTATVGPPFLMLSTSGPLLQRWFAHTGRESAGDPYFLYAASNAGSLLALLCYPALIEPNFQLSSQSRLWSIGYAALTALFLVCAASLLKNKAGKTAPAAMEATRLSNDGDSQTHAIAPARRLRWVALAFAPASLMYGVTTYLTTDLVSVPLLWVLPLSVYLITFILVFARRRILPLRLLDRLLPLLAILLTFLMLTRLNRPIWLLGALHLLFLFVAATVCHGRLAGDRPPSKHLTEFYLWVSLGGALGGLFNSLLAPIIFDAVIEYPLAIVLSLLLRPAYGSQRSASRWPEVAAPLAVWLLTAGLAALLPRLGVATMLAVVLTLAVPLLLSYAWAMRPARFALSVGAVMLGSLFYQGLYYGSILRIERSFFGVLRVARDQTGAFHQLFHGNTGHGRQFIEPARQCEPLSYYHRRGPLGQIFEFFDSRQAAPEVAVVGLGAGAMVCYSKAGQRWSFYEIDPAVAGIARDYRYFTYLQNCARAPVRIVIGDARLQLRNSGDGRYGLLVLDAFSSDVIPTHLLTQQAFDLYLSKLAPGGLLALHTSNQYLDLCPVIADLAAEMNLSGLVNTDLTPPSGEQERGKDSSQWVILTRDAEHLGDLGADTRWQPLKSGARTAVWTDDYSNILGVFKWK